MKKKYIFLTALICALSTLQNVSASPTSCNDTRSDARNYKNFTRTYRSFKTTFESKGSNSLEVTQQDFLDHLSIEKSRTALLLDTSFKMNIGNIDSGTDEIWELPNLVNMNASSIDIAHVSPESSGVLDDFPEDATHAIYAEATDTYEIFSLNEFDLFLYGFGVIDEDDEDEDGDFEERIAVDYYGTQSPVPLKLGESYEGIVTFINDAPEATELDSIQYTDFYDVIGQGTLKTFDDGDAAALKLIYTEETREFKDGVEVSFATRDEIIFYSKRGHYIRASIDDARSSEGEVTLNDIIYQKISGKTASVNEDVNTITKLFPNPVNAGHVLSFESKISLQETSAEVYDINGRKIATLKLNAEKNSQYNINVPENLSSGLYLYTIKDKKGSVITNGKIQVK